MIHAIDTFTIRILDAVGIVGGLVANVAVACDALGYHNILFFLIEVGTSPQPHLLACVWCEGCIYSQALRSERLCQTVWQTRKKTKAAALLT